MVCDTYFRGDSIVHRLDPRVRIVATVAFSILVAVSWRFETLATAAAVSILLAVLARLPAWPLLKRLAAVNAFLLVLWIVLPLTTAGPAGLEVGGFALSRAGLERAARITLKSNAIVLGMTALLSTIETVSLGHVLRHLRLPTKLVHLLLLTVRYIDLLHHEYQRLRQAMKVRCFRPRMTRHTYRSMGYLVGMLLVNSLDRSARVLAAMKCRGFHGEFYAFDHFAAGGRDVVFAAAWLTGIAALGLLEWL